MQQSQGLQSQRIKFGAIGAFVCAPIVFYIGTKQTNKRFQIVLMLLGTIWALSEIYFLTLNTAKQSSQ
jgi:glucose uptake protein GlcU